MPFSALAGTFKKFDPNDASFSSERKNQSKQDIEQISKLIERNNGQLFKVEYDRTGFLKDDQKSGGYYSDDDLLLGNEKMPNGERPIFKIKFKPRSRCHLH